VASEMRVSIGNRKRFLLVIERFKKVDGLTVCYA
jgi:hypothetical protein